MHQTTTVQVILCHKLFLGKKNKMAKIEKFGPEKKFSEKKTIFPEIE